MTENSVSPENFLSQIRGDLLPIDKKLFFVHIPKTAGNAVRTAMTAFISNNARINKSEKEHEFASGKAQRIIGSHRSFNTRYFKNYLKSKNYKESKASFCVVRNPFDLLASYHFHYADNSKTKNWIDNGWANVNSYHNINSFEQFIDLYTSIDPEDWHVPSLCRNLFGQIFCDEGKSTVDYALYQENLVNCCTDIIVQEIIGIKPEWYEDAEVELAVNRMRRVFFNTFKKINVSSRRGSIKSRKNYMDLYNHSMIKKVRKKCEWELDTFYSDNANLKKISDLIKK